MSSKSETPEHALVKAEILEACKDLGFNAIQEYKGKGWRADVFATRDSKRFAFEIQISPQSLKKTLERQEKYTRDGIIGCWLFQKPISRLSDERPDLPLFYVVKQADSSFCVSLSGRRELGMHDFLEQYLNGHIRFCNGARAKPDQHVKLVFYEMECWKCKAMNHIYYVDVAFYTACNALVRPEETLWGSDQKEYFPEIVQLANEFISTEEGKHLHLGEIKPRFSKTVQDAYMSFGCYKCDSIFGDWFVMEAQMEAIYGYGQVASVERDIKLIRNIEMNIPHWCYPDDLQFCDNS